MIEYLINELCKQYDYFLLDLDNTLYDESKYLYPAYRAIAQKLTISYSLNEIELESFLIKTFESEGREKLFDKLCGRFNVPQDATGDMLSVMRNLKLTTPIDLYPSAKSFIDRLGTEQKKVFIVTNGNIEQQQNKVASIDWSENVEYLNFIYTALYEPKPGRASFDYLVKEYSLIPEKSLMIGDTETDEQFAKNSGIRFIHAGTFLTGFA